MGAQHAACGAAGWVALASSETVDISAITEPIADSASWLAWLPGTLTLGFGLVETGPAGVIIGANMCAGAAMLPDIDHPQASIAHSLPPATKVVAQFFSSVSGGHRHGTHSILGVVFFGFLAWLAGFLVIHDVPAVGSLYLGAGSSR